MEMDSMKASGEPAAKRWVLARAPRLGTASDGGACSPLV